MKNKLVLLFAILIGVFAFWLSARYLSNQKAALYAGAVKVRVIVAKKDLPAMTVLTPEDVGTRLVYKSAVGENVFMEDDFQRIRGKRLQYPVKKNSPIMWSQVDMPRERQSGLAPIIKTRSRAISIAISGAPAVSGLIKPNDHVDVLGTFTFPSRVNPQVMESVTLTLMQNVSVLATGSQIAGAQQVQDNRAGGYSTVTFEVSPEEAELLVFAQQTRGQLYLTLRNPNDIYAKDTLPSVNFDYLEAQLKIINEARQLEIRRDSSFRAPTPAPTPDPEAE